jgi:hypothetical protein
MFTPKALHTPVTDAMEFNPFRVTVCVFIRYPRVRRCAATLGFGI